MYFFVVRERRRTAIELSLGLTRRQCRASLMALIFLAAWVLVGKNMDVEPILLLSTKA